jgi:hypothetical protein
MKSLILALLPDRLAICRLPPDAPLPPEPPGGPLWSVTRTPHELSLVLAENAVQEDWKAERGWRCLAVEGPLDFSLVGIMASLSAPLAEARVSLFAVSTYDTDYVLVREENLERAIEALRGAGHRVEIP